MPEPRSSHHFVQSYYDDQLEVSVELRIDEAPVEVDHERTMWRWDFEATRVDTGESIFSQSLFVAAPVVQGFLYWTETGCGITCEDRIVVRWRDPRCVREGGRSDRPVRLVAGLDQSTCHPERTTNIEGDPSSGRWGTRQSYGVMRTTDHGAQLYGP